MENAKKRNNEQNNITIYRSLYRRIFQIPAKKLVDKERKNTAKLIGVLLVLGMSYDYIKHCILSFQEL